MFRRLGERRKKDRNPRLDEEGSTVKRLLYYGESDIVHNIGILTLIMFPAKGVRKQSPKEECLQMEKVS